jgi:hypothetical protein
MISCWRRDDLRLSVSTSAACDATGQRYWRRGN